MVASLAMVAAGLTVTVGAVSQASPRPVRHSDAVSAPATVPAAVYRSAASAKTPIKHLVVIFDEKVKPHDIPLILNPATGAVVSGGERRP